MKYKFVFTARFKKQVQKLDGSVQRQIKQTIDKFIINPDYCDWIKLQGYQNLYRIRTGDYRIIFEKQEQEIIVIMFLSVSHRSQAYKNL